MSGTAGCAVGGDCVWLQELISFQFDVSEDRLHVNIQGKEGHFGQLSDRSEGFRWFLSFYVNFVAFLRTFEELGVHHIQFNVITADLLRRAMKEPEKYRDLLVRVGSYCSYFVELGEDAQLDIINRTEQNRW